MSEKLKASPELIAKYHKWLIMVKREERGRPPPVKCQKCEI